MSRLKTDAIRNVNASVDGITLDTSGNVAIPEGKVSIGTGTARQLLHLNVDDSGAANIVFTNATTGTAASDGFVIGITGSEDGQIWHQESANIKFGTGDSERLRIDNNGKILIATTTTSEAGLNNDELIIGSSSDDANHGLTIVTPSSRYGTVAFSDGSGGKTQGLLEYNHSGDYMRIYTAASEKVRITSGGQVLVGATSGGNADTDDLIVSGSGKRGMTICSTDGDICSLTFADGLSGVPAVMGSIKYMHNIDSLDLYTSTTRRLRIDSSGRLLIGNTDGATYADSANDDLIIGSTSNGKNDGITILSGTAQNGSLAFADSGGAYKGLVGYVHNGDYLRLHAGNTLKVRIDTDGLKFNSDTASANALDDYETGSWTPAFSNYQSGAGSWTYTFQEGKYTKTGNHVSAWFYVAVSAMATLPGGGGSGDYLVLAGLPFTAQNHRANEGASVLLNWWKANGTGCNSGNQVTGFVQRNYSRMLFGQRTNNHIANLSPAAYFGTSTGNFGSAAYMYGMVTYFT